MASIPNTPPNPPAGWFPDPWGAAEMRYWDGAQWTAHVHPPAAPAQAPAQPAAAQPVAAQPAAAQPAAAQPAAEPQGVGAPPGVGGAPITTIPIATPNADKPDDGERRKQILTAALAVAILIVVVVAIIRIAGGSSSSASTPTPAVEAPPATATAPAKSPAGGDAKAKEEVHTAQVAIETFGTENRGSYAGATDSTLTQIEPSLSPRFQVEEAGRKTYRVSATSKDGAKFEIVRGKAGGIAYICTPPGHGACPAGGHWR
jgi:hypothetical protein